MQCQVLPVTASVITLPNKFTALLYLGAGTGMGIANCFLIGDSGVKEARLARADFPYIAAMVALDIPAPILLMLGLATTTAATASLLVCFEIVATSVTALKGSDPARARSSSPC